VVVVAVQGHRLRGARARPSGDDFHPGDRRTSEVPRLRLPGYVHVCVKRVGTRDLVKRVGTRDLVKRVGTKDLVKRVGTRDIVKALEPET